MRQVHQVMQTYWKRAVKSIMRHVTADVWSKSCCRDTPEGVYYFNVSSKT